MMDDVERGLLWGYLAVGLSWVLLAIWGLFYLATMQGMEGVAEKIALTLARRWN